MAERLQQPRDEAKAAKRNQAQAYGRAKKPKQTPAQAYGRAKAAKLAPARTKIRVPTQIPPQI